MSFLFVAGGPRFRVFFVEIGILFQCHDFFLRIADSGVNAVVATHFDHSESAVVFRGDVFLGAAH